MPRYICLILAGGLLFLAGCGAPTWQTYEETSVAASSPGDGMGSLPEGHPPIGGEMGRARQPAGAAMRGTGRAIRWTAPDGWKEEAGSGMRMASFTLQRGERSGLCTIVSLGGAAGGLEANVRRWIGQLNLSEPTPDELSAFLDRQEKISSEGGYEGALVDLTELGDPDPEGSSMMAALLAVEDKTLFLKFTGPVGLLREEKAAFATLCRSVKTEN